nr:(Na+)-NQR maturation NqrM [Marinimicrobium alkaliphilum]
MAMFVVTLFVMLLIVTAMSVGVLFGRTPIKGSCGGVGAALKEKDYVCDFCGNDESKCEELQEQGVVEKDHKALAYDAGQKQQ